MFQLQENEDSALPFDPGARPVFRWINKNLLRVDNGAKGYQRQKSAKWIRRMLSKFKWAPFGAVLVSERGGVFYVMDAQNRVELAKLIPQITDVPCLVYRHSTRQEEARTFNMINKDRRNLKPLENWKSDMAAREPLTLSTNSCLLAHGFSVGPKSDILVFKCPEDLKELQAGGRLGVVLKFLTNTWPDDALRTKSCVVSGIGRFIGRFNSTFEREPSVDELHAVFSKHSLLPLYQRGRNFAYADDSSGREGFCRAMIEKWNTGRRTTRMPLHDATAAVH